MPTLKCIRVAKQLVQFYCAREFIFRYIHAFQNGKTFRFILMNVKLTEINKLLVRELKIFK